MTTRSIRIPSATEIEDAEIGLLDDYKSGNVSKGINGIANGTQNGVVATTTVTSPASSLRRGHASKSASDVRSPFDDVEAAEGEKTVKKARTRNVAFLSGLAYCVSSCGMILLNKTVLSGYGLKGGISLMFYQNVISVLLVVILQSAGAITTEPVTWKLVKVWFPVNCLFVGMLVTSTYSLKFMNVAMVTILKNVTNLITACGEIYYFNKHHNNKVWGSLGLMVISAVTGGITDLSFHAVGYAWQLLNCFCTSAYSLRLRKVMDLAKQKTVSGNLNEFSMVLLNNLLSIPLGLVLILIFESDVLSMTALRIPMFWVVATMSGVLGLAISFTSMWFLHQTSPTTHSLVGSLNKIPLSLAGIVIFNVPTSVPNMMSIFFGLFAGVMFAKAKMSG
ncbi:hypothetical protein M758_10G176300 [Ceratodon purpureus]|nr:hypothetical protein M758_10G176300 [Ceratodon purpureus]